MRPSWVMRSLWDGCSITLTGPVPGAQGCEYLGGQQMKRVNTRRVAFLAFCGVVASLLLTPAAALAQTVEPSSFSATLDPGETACFEMTVTTGTTPVPSADIVFTIDRTGSMWDEIDEVKESAADIMTAIRAVVPDSQFGVASFMDYPGFYSYPGYADIYGEGDDVAYEVNQQVTDDIGVVATAINSLWLGSGYDWPQDYTRVLYELKEDDPAYGAIGWRGTAKKIVVMFGDAPTHDLDFAGYNYGGDPGRDAVAETADDLDFETVVGELLAEGIRVVAVDSGGSPESAATFKGMSIGYDTAPGTGGQYFELANAPQIPDAVLDMIEAEVSIIEYLTLQVPAEFQDWVDFTPAGYENVGPETTVVFDVCVTVPAGTDAGLYTFPVDATGDGAVLGTTEVSITVPTTGAIPGMTPYAGIGAAAALGLAGVIMIRRRAARQAI